MGGTVPTRWWFTGVSGSGKSTYAAAVARALEVTHHELDGTFHLPNWQPLAVEQFRARVLDYTNEDGWTIDGNYSVVRPIIVRRVQVIVGLDLPRAVVMGQIVRRTLSRRIHNEELWNGNKEAWHRMFRWDPDKSIIRWSWTTYDKVHERHAWFERYANQRGITYLHVTSHEEARQRIAALLGDSSSSFLG